MQTKEKGPKKILLVDDDLLTIRMYEKKFIDDGYSVFTSESGLEALDAVEQVRPDIILLDIMMPGMDGMEVLEKIKHHKSMSHIPVVVLTNLDATEENVTKAKKYGAVDFFTKTKVHPIHVVARVKELLK